jgi:hypothetical protein
MVIIESRRKKMKKTIITVFAFLVVFGFAITGTMAQAWTWADPVNFSHTGTGKQTELTLDPTNDFFMYGIDDGTGGAKDGAFEFTGSDTIKTKPAKGKK